MIRGFYKGIFGKQHRSILERHLAGAICSYSAWISTDRCSLNLNGNAKIDVERLFTNHNVQTLLREITGVDLEGKIFAFRKISKQERSHYALMTNQMYEKTLERMTEEGKNFLQFVPVKEPRPDLVEVLAHDEEISSFDDCKFVFTDITYDATDQDRTVVVREPNGILRTATPEEHDRMNRIYYEQPHRPVFPPPIFEDPYLQDALNRNQHEFILDWACYYFEPDDPEFVKLSKLVYDRTCCDKKFDELYSTRHFGPFVFYLAINNNLPPLMNYFGSKGSLSDVAKLIRLQKLIHPNWRMMITSDDNDEKIVKDYLKQNRELLRHLDDLVSLVEGRSSKQDSYFSEGMKLSPSYKPSLNDANIQQNRGDDSPLGDMAEDYPVYVVRNSDDLSSENAENKKIHQRRNRRAWRRWDETENPKKEQ